MFEQPRVGLCVRCVHHRVTGNRRGSRFHLCELAATDARFRKYPPLPVFDCDGFEEAPGPAFESPDREIPEPSEEA